MLEEPVQSSAAGGGNDAPPALPASLRCARCDYPTGLSGLVTCPECGWVATPAELELVKARAAVVGRWRREEKARAIARWTIVAVVYGLGAGSITGAPLIGLTGAAAIAIAVAGSWAVGGWGVARCVSERRDYLRVAWARDLWALHLPWLVAPLVVAFALVAGAFERWGAEQGVYARVVLTGFFAWLAGSLGAFLWWWRLRRRRIAKGGYTPGRADGVAFALGLAMLAGAMLLGFGAGALAAEAGHQLLGLGSFIGWD